MSKISFVKMSGLGNDFVIIDSRLKNLNLTPKKISLISKRNIIGCDQLIILKNPIDPAKSIISMEIYNSDGSLSSTCGNATRCVSSLIMEESNLNKILIETAAGTLSCYKEDDSEESLIVVNMGYPKFNWQDIPLSKPIKNNKIVLENIEFFFINVGNPHIVAFIDNELTDEKFFELGPKLENNPLFLERTNIEFVTKISQNNFKVRVWERGVGETLSCGSGACSVGYIALKNKFTNSSEVKITFKGGDIFIKLDSNGNILMKGEVLKIFDGIIDDNLLKKELCY